MVSPIPGGSIFTVLAPCSLSIIVAMAAVTIVESSTMRIPSSGFACIDNSRSFAGLQRRIRRQSPDSGNRPAV
jgi:hypothetical protein